MKTIKINVTGTVQGVFFRKFIKDSADKFRVRGFVRNLDNGQIEIVAEGKDENVNSLLSTCSRGPLHSEIKNVESREIRYQGFDRFKILRI
jgi:acylphosphatase